MYGLKIDNLHLHSFLGCSLLFLAMDYILGYSGKRKKLSDLAVNAYTFFQSDNNCL